MIGGGAAGVEFASEIKSDYPGKDVTLIHSSKKIIDYPLVTDNFREQVMGIVDRIQVKVILGEPPRTRHSQLALLLALSSLCIRRRSFLSPGS